MQNKSYYNETIESVFKKEITKKFDYRPKTDQEKDMSGDSIRKRVDEQMLFFYTDAETAFSILTEKVIYPSQLTASLNNFKLEDTKITKESCVYLVDNSNPKYPDNILKMKTCNYSQEIFYQKCNPKFNKLDYAFGFKYIDLKEGDPFSMFSPRLVNTTMYGYGKKNKTWMCKEKDGKKINLDKINFILVKRKFKNCLLYKNMAGFH